MKIYTDAPGWFDSSKTAEVETLGCLRVVTVDGTETDTLDQLIHYTNNGFYATVYRTDAIGVVVEMEKLQGRLRSRESKAREPDRRVDPGKETSAQ